MSERIHKSHNVTTLMYHVVIPAKYRRAVVTKEVDQSIRETCMEIEKRFEIFFLEIGTDKDYVHLLIQTVPNYKLSEVIKKIKSITAREVFTKHPEVKKQLWGGEFWTDGFYANTVGKHASEEVIKAYVKNQGTTAEYNQLYLFDSI